MLARSATSALSSLCHVVLVLNRTTPDQTDQGFRQTLLYIYMTEFEVAAKFDAIGTKKKVITGGILPVSTARIGSRVA
jgi:hypothetical protein